MPQQDKLLERVLRGKSDANIPFEGVEEIINLQPKGAKAKAYQVRQVRNLILKYRLGGEDGSV